MYSVILMAAATVSPQAPAHPPVAGCYGSCYGGCYGSYAAYGHYAAYGRYAGQGASCFGCAGCYGTHGSLGTYGTMGTYGTPGTHGTHWPRFGSAGGYAGFGYGPPPVIFEAPMPTPDKKSKSDSKEEPKKSSGGEEDEVNAADLVDAALWIGRTVISNLPIISAFDE